MKKSVAPFLTNDESARSSTKTLYNGTFLGVEVRIDLKRKSLYRTACGYKRRMVA